MLPEFTFHHIGIATPTLSDTALYYVNAGYKMSEKIYDPFQNVNICFLSKEAMPVIELLEPLDEKSPVTQIIEKSGVSPYHVCYEVDDILSSIVKLKKMKYILLFTPIEAIALENRKICFLFNKHVGLIELVEKVATS